MPDKLSPEFDQFYIDIIDLANDLWTPVFFDQVELL
jgi:hypothetical protein